MGSHRFDELTRTLGAKRNRRGVLAGLGKGLGAAVVAGGLTRLRSQEAAALPYCGNCDQICDNCFGSGNWQSPACNVCGHCLWGSCSPVPPR